MTRSGVSVNRAQQERFVRGGGVIAEQILPSWEVGGQGDRDAGLGGTVVRSCRGGLHTDFTMWGKK